MTYLGQSCRTYALDFWGFGESGKKRSTYEVTDFVSLVDQFMERLGIAQAPIVGHSMGGTVSLMLALPVAGEQQFLAAFRTGTVDAKLLEAVPMADLRRIAASLKVASDSSFP